MKDIKVILKDGSEVFTPEGNLETFRRIHFNNIFEIIYADSKGEYKASKKIVSQVDISSALNSYIKENESLVSENESLKKTIEELNTIIDSTIAKAKKSKTK